MKRAIKDFKEAVKQATKENTQPYDTQAEVIRTEGSTLWVHIPGGVDETPVKKTINAKTGDTVQVRVGGGSAWLVGNASAPPTDDTRANIANTTAVQAKAIADNAMADAEIAHDAAQSAVASAASAQTSANNALISANNAAEYASRALGNLSTVQSVAETLTWITQHGTMALTTDVALDPTHVYFVLDAGGDYTVGGNTYSIVTEPNVADIGTYYELTIDESLNNYVGTHLALTQEGLWLLPASSGTNKVLIATGAGTQYTTAGTYLINSSSGVVASFRANGVTIGETTDGKSRIEVSTDGMQIFHKSSGTSVPIAQLGYGPALNEYGTLTTAPYYTFGTRAEGSTIGEHSSTMGEKLTASAECAHAEGYVTGTGSAIIASGLGSHAEGEAQGGHKITASGTGSHAEGEAIYFDMLASGTGAHAEGGGTTASGLRSHAEGSRTTASGAHAHSEGFDSVASGDQSHAGGYGTIADQDYQTAIGEWNTANNTNNLFVIGNGTGYYGRHDAFTVDNSGNTYANGDVNIASGKHYKINGTNLSASDVSAVALSDKYTRSNAGGLDWVDTTEGDAKVIAKSALAFWNGSYNGTTSNLSKCSTGNIIGSNGGTMTGQLLTSFKTSVAMGSYGSAQTTVPNFIDEVRMSSGCAGSVSIGTAYTANGVTIATGWYNFMYIPHRSGGMNGSASGDNCNYGNCFLFGMNNTNGRFIIRVSSGSIAEVCRLVTTVEMNQTLSSTGLSPYSSRCTIDSGGKYKIGKMVFVQMSTTVKTSLSANNYWAYISGMDEPATTNVALSASVAGLNGGAISAYINKSDKNIVIETDNAALANGNVITLTGWYMSV